MQLFRTASEYQEQFLQQTGPHRFLTNEFLCQVQLFQIFRVVLLMLYLNVGKIQEGLIFRVHHQAQYEFDFQ